MLSEQRLSEIRARLKAATPGPWMLSEAKYSVPGEVVVSDVDGDFRSILTIRADDVPVVDKDDDAAFIVNAPTDIADLLAEVERLRAHGAEVGDG